MSREHPCDHDAKATCEHCPTCVVCGFRGHGGLGFWACHADGDVTPVCRGKCFKKYDEDKRARLGLPVPAAVDCDYRVGIVGTPGPPLPPVLECKLPADDVHKLLALAIALPLRGAELAPEQVAKLRTVTLEDMVRTIGWVKAKNERTRAIQTTTGWRTVGLEIDARLLAALYLALHDDGDSRPAEDRPWRPRSIVEIDGRHVCVLDVSTRKDRP